MMRKVLFFAIIFCIFICACQKDVGPQVHVRTEIKSEKSNNYADISVFVEGYDGNAINGAMVFIGTNMNSFARASFNQTEYCYKLNCKIPNDNIFNFSVSSTLLENNYAYSITHIHLKKSPNITDFRDSNGNSILNGESISATSDAQLSWDAVSNKAVYIVTIKTALENIYYQSTGNCNIIIPKNTLKDKTTYFLQIEAQHIDGDLLFKTADYCSVSRSTSKDFMFTTQ